MVRDRRDPMPRGGGSRRPGGERGASREHSPSAQRAKSGIDPFELFCAYHLGIGPDKAYRPSNIHDVARRFGVDAGVIRQTLQNYAMDPETIIDLDFDLTMAQVDIQVAPQGVDRLELAKGIYEEFRKSPRKKRDWQKILADDARENARIFGRKD